MKIILLQDVKALGKKGETVDVSDGYARNCILPKKLGVEANAKNMNDLKLQKAHEEKVAKEQLEEAKALAEKMAEMEVILSIKSGKDGRTFGSVSTKEIAVALKEQHGLAGVGRLSRNPALPSTERCARKPSQDYPERWSS